MKALRPKKASKNSKSVFVLMIGDEGSIMVHMQNRRVVKRVFAQSPDKEHIHTMDELLNSYPNAPITLLVDMMDQSYVRQTLPPVSSFNVGKIIRRRLNKDFSTDDIKGYLIFGRDKKGRKDWNYLMASLANPPLLQKWIDFVVERRNLFKGLGLVPLECQPLLQAIEAAQLAKMGKEAKPSEWHILISHHKVGGFRQIVLKSGQLVFTRLAQLVGEPTPEVIAGNIEQEMLNTLEYLKRLGLQDTNNLTTTIIASSDIKSVFDPKSIRVGQCYFYTPYEAATLLGMEEVAKPEDHFGDVVVAGFIGRKRKLLLTLFTAYTRKIAKMAQYIVMARTAAVLMMLGIFAWAGLTASDLFTAQGGKLDLEDTQQVLGKQYATEEDKKRTLPEKINTYIDVANMFKYFYKPVFDAQYFASKVPSATGDLALIKTYKWSLSSAIAAPKDEDKKTVTVEFESILSAPAEPRAELAASAQKLVDSVKKTFPDFQVTNSDLPGVLSDSKEIKFSDTAGGSTVQTDVASTSVKFTLKGPVAVVPEQLQQQPLRRELRH